MNNETKMKKDRTSCCVGFLGITAMITRAATNILAWRWRQYVPPNSCYLPTCQHGVTTQEDQRRHLCSREQLTSYRARWCSNWLWQEYSQLQKRRV